VVIKPVSPHPVVLRSIVGVIAGGVLGMATLIGGSIGAVIAAVLFVWMIVSRRADLAGGTLIGWGLTLVVVSSLPLANHDPAVFYPSDARGWLVAGAVATAAGAVLWLVAIRRR
jgi:hypothetical protein